LLSSPTPRTRLTTAAGNKSRTSGKENLRRDGIRFAFIFFPQISPLSPATPPPRFPATETSAPTTEFATAMLEGSRATGPSGAAPKDSRYPRAGVPRGCASRNISAANAVPTKVTRLPPMLLRSRLPIPKLLRQGSQPWSAASPIGRDSGAQSLDVCPSNPTSRAPKPICD